MAERKRKELPVKTSNAKTEPLSDDMKTAIKEIVGSKAKPPTKGRGGTANFANVQDDATEEDKRTALTEVLRWTKMPPVQSDDECAERIELYFTSCAERGVRPVWEELALALGCYDRTQLWKWQQGMGCSVARSNMIKAANIALSAYDARLAINGKMNPVPYIFRAKNYYGMKDEQEVVVTPNNPLGDAQNEKDIADKYKALPEE